MLSRGRLWREGMDRAGRVMGVVRGMMYDYTGWWSGVDISHNIRTLCSILV